MPFPDESFAHQVVVVAPDPGWADEGTRLATALHALAPVAARVDHIGSTSVPGLPAKDCLDMQVQVRPGDADEVGRALEDAGYRRRPEPWNQVETSYAEMFRKQVFAPPSGSRSTNVHVREQGGLNVRYALLFRDYLRADPVAADAWGRFKLRLAQDVVDLAAYGQIKAPAQEILISAADLWAERTGWTLS